MGMHPVCNFHNDLIKNLDLEDKQLFLNRFAVLILFLTRDNPDFNCFRNLFFEQGSCRLAQK